MTELQVTLTGTVEASSTVPLGTAVTATFDVDTLSGSLDLQSLNGVPFQLTADNLAVTNFSATLNGLPVSTSPFALANLVGQSDAPGGTPGLWEPLFSVSSQGFTWDFLAGPLVSVPSDPVGALMLSDTSSPSGSLAGNAVDWSHQSITSVPAPDTLPLMASALVVVVLLSLIRQSSKQKHGFVRASGPNSNL